MFPKASLHPIIFEEIYIKEKGVDSTSQESTEVSITQIMPTSKSFKKSIQSNKTHIIVMVHGFQGNSFDMRLFKDNLSLKFPELMFLSSSSNEN